MQPFAPEPLPPQGLDWGALIPRISSANRSLATYAGILQAIPGPEALLSPITTQEAVLSSKIEGTQATLSDVLKFEAGDPPKQHARRVDVQEILNYRKALLAAEADLPQRGFTLHTLRTMHEILMGSVRGADKTPGEFRKTQNWIGAEGCPIEDAVFVPPSPIGLIDHLEAWQAYFASDERDPLVQLAIIHAQFEIIHPFMDGNGRLGRILIPLFLFEKGVLPRPMFYLSSWLEERRDEYIGRLRQLGRTKTAWNEWCDFFLRGIDEQGTQNGSTAREIKELYEAQKKKALELTHSQFAIPLLDEAYRRPIFTSSHLDFGERVPSQPMVSNLLRSLTNGGILRVVRKGSGRRATIYALVELINLCEGKKVF